MKEVSIEDIKSKFFEYSNLLQPPLIELEQVWNFVQRVFLDRYPRIRFWVADPQDKKYYGFRSVGMTREFEKKFDCKGYNPFEVRKYPVSFDEVPKDLKHPIEGDEESYILNYKVIDEWCKKGNSCPEYIQDIGYGIEIDEAVTIHIPHRLSRKTPLGAISLDFGRKGRTFNEDEINILISIIGTFLRDVITPLIEADLVEARKKINLTNGISMSLPQSSVSLSTYDLTYNLPNPRYGLIVYNDKDSNHPFIQKGGLFEIIEKTAKSSACVLILGETGTGKQLVAEAIHKLSDRCNGPFIETNMGRFSPEGISADLELFGGLDNKGNVNSGLFKLANGGTLFLDEIGEAEGKVQTKLLKVLDEGWVEPVGIPKEAGSVNVRVIAATKRDINELVEKGSFRDDLYFRLNGIQITLPPLRSRLTDLLPLIRYFTKKKCVPIGKNKSIYIDPEALELLFAYNWPGNIRELERVIENIIVLADDTDPVIIKRRNLPEQIRKIQIKSEYPDELPILLYKPEKPIEEITANELGEVVNKHLEGLKQEGKMYLNRVFPLQKTSDRRTQIELEALLRAIPGDKKKYINENINNFFCNSCDKKAQNVTHYLECNAYKNRDCGKPILPPGTFESRYKYYNINLSTKQGRPTKRLQEKNLNQKVKIENNSPHRDIEIKCKELLKKAGFNVEDAIKELDCNTFMKAYKNKFEFWGKKPEKEAIAIKEAYEIAKSKSKSGTKIALDNY